MRAPMYTRPDAHTDLSDHRASIVARETADLLRELDQIERRLALFEQNVRRLVEEIDDMPSCNLTLVPAND